MTNLKIDHLYTSIASNCSIKGLRFTLWINSLKFGRKYYIKIIRNLWEKPRENCNALGKACIKI